MPIYEYVCRKGHEFEEIQSFSAEPVARCPHCGGKSQRKISLSAFHLKGSGWYLTDSRPASPSPEGATKEAGAGESAMPEAKSGAEASAPPAASTEAASTPPAAPSPAAKEAPASNKSKPKAPKPVVPVAKPLAHRKAKPSSAKASSRGRKATKR